MVFVFGGAYQGMEEYVREACGAECVQALNAACAEIDFSAQAVSGLEQFVLGCVQRGESAVDYFEKHAGEWAHCALIGMDFSCGVVPVDAQMRLWREENGRLNNYLSGKAQRVVRMFCGLPQVLK